MKITSSAFEHKQPIPFRFSCDGSNINPALKIAEVPPNAKSLVLIVDDSDAVGGKFTHWLLYNIDPKTTDIEENSVPHNARQATTSFGGKSYGGPCPPSGTHRYHFKLFALDTELALSDSADIEDVENAMENHVIDWTELIGLYSRK